MEVAIICDRRSGDEDGEPLSNDAVLLFSDAGFPIDLANGPDGSLYNTDLLQGVVRQLRQAPDGLFGDVFGLAEAIEAAVALFEKTLGELEELLGESGG